jgi:hypothetical protein
MIHSRAKIVSRDEKIEFTDFCDVYFDWKLKDGEINWFGSIVLPPGKAAALDHKGHLLALVDGKQRNITFRELYTEPALFDGLGPAPWTE